MNLNLGCGRKKIPNWINIDSNPKANPDLLWDLEKSFPYENDTVDNILLDNVMEHLNIDLMLVIVECKRILKPNGMLTIISPNCYHWKARLAYLTGKFKAKHGYHYDHRWFLKPSWLKALLEKYGFETNKVSDFFDNELVIKARKRA